MLWLLNTLYESLLMIHLKSMYDFYDDENFMGEFFNYPQGNKMNEKFDAKIPTVSRNFNAKSLLISETMFTANNQL